MMNRNTFTAFAETWLRKLFELIKTNNFEDTLIWLEAINETFHKKEFKYAGKMEKSINTGH